MRDSRLAKRDENTDTKIIGAYVKFKGGSAFLYIWLNLESLFVKLRISHKVICQVVDAIKSNKTRNKSRQSGDQADKENYQGGEIKVIVTTVISKI